MDHKDSLPRVHVPATCPYSQPVHNPIPLPEDQFNIILPSTTGSSKWFHFLSLPCLHRSSLPTCYIHHLFSISLPE